MADKLEGQLSPMLATSGLACSCPYHQGSARLCCPDEIQGLLSPVLYQMRGGASFPAFMICLVHLFRLPMVGWIKGRGEDFSLDVSTTQQTTARANSALLVPSGASSPATSIRASSAVLPRQGTGPVVVRAAAAERQRHLSCSQDSRPRSPPPTKGGEECGGRRVSSSSTPLYWRFRW